MYNVCRRSKNEVVWRLQGIHFCECMHGGTKIIQNMETRQSGGEMDEASRSFRFADARRRAPDAPTSNFSDAKWRLLWLLFMTSLSLYDVIIRDHGAHHDTNCVRALSYMYEFVLLFLPNLATVTPPYPLPPFLTQSRLSDFSQKYRDAGKIHGRPRGAGGMWGDSGPLPPGFGPKCISERTFRQQLPAAVNMGYFNALVARNFKLLIVVLTRKT